MYAHTCIYCMCMDTHTHTHIQITSDVVDTHLSGRLHPLEAVSRQLDPINTEDDWGLQEVRVAADVVADTTDTVAMANDTADAGVTTGGDLAHKEEVQKREKREKEKPDVVDGKFAYMYLCTRASISATPFQCAWLMHE